MKKRLICGIQPTNRLTLGNYLGAIKPMVDVQGEYECLLFVADWHSMTIPLTYHQFSYSEINNFSWNVAKMYLACGMDMNRVRVFIQSQVKEHLEMFYFLLTHSSVGELSRMTQYKHLSKKFTEPNQTEMALTGLLIYPVLMAADILIYDADYVSVGADQLQHLELTHDIAGRINRKYGKKLFKIPGALRIDNHVKIRDLQDPAQKMSKSSTSWEGVIFLDEEPSEIRRKIMRAKTDSLGKISLDWENQPGIVNLLNIYALTTGGTIEGAYEKMRDYSYHQLKGEVANVVIETLSEIKTQYEAIDNEELRKYILNNGIFCQQMAKNKLNDVYKKLG